MSYRKRRSGGRRRRSRRPSVSVATYADLINLQAAPAAADTTKAAIQNLSQVKNTSGETVNRKIVRVSGDLAFATQPSAGHVVVAQFALWAHPEIDSDGVTELDPFVTGPGGAQPSADYEGRPSPRPFGRKLFAHVLQTGGTATQFFESFRYMTKAQRLLRPGWVLSAALWARSTEANVNVSVGGAIRVVVEG